MKGDPARQKENHERRHQTTQALRHPGRHKQVGRNHQSSLSNTEIRTVDKKERAPSMTRIIRESFRQGFILEMSLKEEKPWRKMDEDIPEDTNSMYKGTGYVKKLWCNQCRSQLGNGEEMYV